MRLYLAPTATNQIASSRLLAHKYIETNKTYPSPRKQNDKKFLIATIQLVLAKSPEEVGRSEETHTKEDCRDN